MCRMKFINFWIFSRFYTLSHSEHNDITRLNKIDYYSLKYFSMLNGNFTLKAYEKRSKSPWCRHCTNHAILAHETLQHVIHDCKHNEKVQCPDSLTRAHSTKKVADLVCPKVVHGSPQCMKDLITFIDQSIHKHVSLSQNAMKGTFLQVAIGDELINKNIMFWNDKNKQYELALVTGYNPSTSYFTLGNPTVNETIPS